MLFMKLHIGDWLTSTQWLSATDRGVYMTLLTIYYSQEAPLMQEQCKRLAKTMQEPEQESLDFVLKKFFELKDGLYYNHRADCEIAEYYASSKRLSKNAKSRWAKEKTADADATTEQTQSKADAKTDAKAMQDACKEPCKNDAYQESKNPRLLNPSNEGSSARDARARTRTRAAAPRLNFYDLPENLIGDWQTQRKAIRAPITQTVIDGFKREAEKAGISLEQAVRFALERNWQGFRASWWKKSSAEEGADAPDVNAEEEAFYSWKRDEYAAGRIPRIEFEEWREKYWIPRQKEMPR